MKSLSIAALAATLLATITAPSLANRCLDGTAPVGWLRPGGYCSISADLNQHQISRGGGGSGFSHHRGRIYDFDYNGWHYHDNGGGNWTVSNGSTTYTYQYHSDGSYTRTP